MNKAELADEMLALYVQYLTHSHSSAGEREKNLSKCVALLSESRQNLEKRYDNQITPLATKTETQRSSANLGPSLMSSKLTDNWSTLQEKPKEAPAVKKQGESLNNLAQLPNEGKQRLFFMRGQSQLREVHPQLGEICEKFSDFKNHSGFLFAESGSRRNFELSDLLGLDNYVLVNCFLTFMLSASLSDNMVAFTNTIARFRSLKPHSKAQNFDFEVFLSKLQEIKSKVEDHSVESAVSLFVECCSREPSFLNGLIWSCKSVIGEFLVTLKQNKRNSYTQKYYITDNLLFGVGAVKEEDNQLYKVIRFSIEAFFIAVNGYCELIYIRKDGLEYHYKTIFINKPKDALLKKRLLLYLLVVGEEHSLFSSFELDPVLADQGPQQMSRGSVEEKSKQKPIEKLFRNESADFSIPEEPKPVRVAHNISSSKDTDLSPKLNSVQRPSISDKLNKALDIPVEFCKSEITEVQHPVFANQSEQPRFRNSHQQPPPPQLSLQEISPKIYQSKPEVDPRIEQSSQSVQVSLTGGKLMSTRMQTEATSLFDRENAVVGLLACLEEMDANFDRLSVQRRRPPREDVFARGRSFGREAPQQHTKFTRTAGRSQDVGLGQRYASGGRLNLVSGGLTNGLGSKITYKADRTNLGGRDNLYRGLNFKYTNSTAGPTTNTYKYINYPDSDFSNSFKRVTTSEHPAYVFN